MANSAGLVPSFPTKIGNMTAYLGKIPYDGKLHPAMIWLTGGMGNGIDKVWEEANADNDQTASVFRKAGLVIAKDRILNGISESDKNKQGSISAALSNFV